MDSSSTQSPTRPQTTTRIPTVGRILHARSPLWAGPRAAIVVNSWGNACCNVHIFADAGNDRGVIGRHGSSLSVYDELSDAQRCVLSDDNATTVWLEWPPFVQAGLHPA